MIHVGEVQPIEGDALLDRWNRVEKKGNGGSQGEQASTQHSSMASVSVPAKFLASGFLP